MSKETNIVEIGDWVLRQRLPEGNGPQRLILLLHGWTGDENSMWIFAPRLPDYYMIVSPRGISNTAMGGYGWGKEGATGWPAAPDFQGAINALFDLVDSLDIRGINTSNFDVMGFSQGAALAYTMILQHPERIGKLAGLSGFLPGGLESEIIDRKLLSKNIFVAHGRKDDMVSLDRARSVVRELKSAGSDVIYCEEDVGHKLSAGCFRGMDDYFSNRS